MKISIVIPNWNGRDKLLKNLPEVLKVKGVDEIIVSDDASPDDSVEIMKKNFPEIKLVERKINGGFSSNVNTAVKEARGDLIFLLNTDAVPSQDCVKYLTSHFEDSKVFSVGANTGGSWSWAKWENGFFWHFSAKDVPQTSHETLWASGGSGIFRKSVWEELNGLDELYNPFYVEDLDLGYRATKRGYINIWEPKALVLHHNQGGSFANKELGVIAANFSKDRVSKTSERNQLIFTWKNITSSELIKEHKKALINRLLNHPKYGLIFYQALKRLPEIQRKRKIELKETKLSDEEILGKFSEKLV